MSKHKLSFQSALFININIMLGSGIFINSTILAQKAGLLGAACYLIVGLLMLPLIISMSKLVHIHPSGGLYTFAMQEISPFAGFVSTWSYIVGKLAASVIITQIAVLLIQCVVPPLAAIPSLILNGMIIACFLLLNLLDTKSNSTIQTIFFWLKTTPIVCAVVAGLYMLNPANITASSNDLGGIPIALPLVLFALSGFEAACSLSSHIENAHINAPRAMLYSYSAVIAITTLFQFSLYAGLGSLLEQLHDYRYLFPTLFSHLIPENDALQNILITTLHLAVACSALGGSYGIIFSNNWNVYTLAKHNHLAGSRILTQLNRYQIPYWCVLLEGMLCFLFLLISRGNQLPLQQLGAFGLTIAFSISAISAHMAAQRGAIHLHAAIPSLALLSTALLASSAIYSLLMDGMSSLVLFFLLLGMGIAMFFRKTTSGTAQSAMNQSFSQMIQPAVFARPLSNYEYPLHAKTNLQSSNWFGQSHASQRHP